MVEQMWRIRDATSDDIDFLWLMLAHAGAWPPGSELATRRAMEEHPMVKVYVEGWGRAGDMGLVAVDQDGSPIGATWLRFHTVEAPGFGFVDEATPEVAIALMPEWRSRGIGRVLLSTLINQARSKGVPAISLSVRRGNPAINLYRSLGFETVAEHDDLDDYVMRLSL
jgi:ribosomal protein S18 acetylase RimI-like enzyme